MRFLFDYISPYAWLAWTQVHAVAEKHGCAVQAEPVLFAGFLKALGHKGPAQIPGKRVYVFKECLRNAELLGVPLEPPPRHPFNPLLALRVTGLDMPEAVRHRLVDRLFRAVWAGGPGVEDPAVVGAIADAVGVPDALSRAAAPEAKQRLRRATEAAIAIGGFGVPTILVGEELFWGLDSLAHVDRYLAGTDPLPQDRLAAWTAQHGD